MGHGDAPVGAIDVLLPAGGVDGGGEVVVAGVGLSPNLDAGAGKVEQFPLGVAQDVDVAGEVVRKALVHGTGHEGVVIAGQDDNGGAAPEDARRFGDDRLLDAVVVEEVAGDEDELRVEFHGGGHDAVEVAQRCLAAVVVGAKARADVDV